ncbi:MAG TPA: hypothetical protein VGL57_02440 [Solirubrobacteraceae bacterium]|jgi:hypothetical protein
MGESIDIELLHRAWGAMSVEGDLGVLEGALDPEAKWRGVEDGPWICENRKMILKVMERNLTGGSSGGSRRRSRLAGGSSWRSVPIGPETTDGRWIRALHTSFSRCARGA